LRAHLGAVIAGVAVAGLAAGNVAFAQDTPAASQAPVLNNHELLHKYVWTTLGPSGVLHAGLVSALDQWRDSPRKWTTDTEGYARRWASDYAASAIGSTTKYGVARLFHQDPSFTRCDCVGVGSRLRYVLASPFTARGRDGQRTFSAATVAGLAAENVIPASTWYPAPRGTRDGALHAAAGIVAKMAVNGLREFGPLHRGP
jgi:hypothetical protein